MQNWLLNISENYSNDDKLDRADDLPEFCALFAHWEKVWIWNAMQKSHQSYWMAKPTGACLEMAADFIVVWNNFKSITVCRDYYRIPFAKRMCEHPIRKKEKIALHSIFNCESCDLSICS